MKCETGACGQPKPIEAIDHHRTDDENPCARKTCEDCEDARAAKERERESEGVGDD